MCCLCMDDEPKWIEKPVEPRSQVIGTARRLWPDSSKWTSSELTNHSDTVWKMLASSGPSFTLEFVTATLRSEFGPPEG